MPARMAWATDRNFGFSSLFLRVVASWRVNVEASHSLTSGGTASGCTSDNSSSSSAKRLFNVYKKEKSRTRRRKRCEKKSPLRLPKKKLTKNINLTKIYKILSLLLYSTNCILYALIW